MLGFQITPLVRFWDRPQHPRQASLEPWELLEVVYSGAIGGSKFLVSLGGYIATEESDPRVAARNLNAFLFALTLLLSHTTDPGGELELDESSFDGSAGTIRPTRGKLSRLGSAFAWYPEFQLQVAKEASAAVYDASVLPTVSDLGDSITGSDHEVAFYEAHVGLSAKHDGEPIAAFVNFWIVLELFLDTEIRRLLKGQGAANSLIDDQLTKWNIPRKVKVLKQPGAMQPLGKGDPTVFSSSELNQVKALAHVRNRVVHLGYRPNSEEVSQVAELGWRAMWRFFRLSGIDYQRFLRTVKGLQAAFAKKHNL